MHPRLLGKLKCWEFGNEKEFEVWPKAINRSSLPTFFQESRNSKPKTQNYGHKGIKRVLTNLRVEQAAEYVR